MYALVRRTDGVPTTVRIFKDKEQASEVMEKEFQECVDKHLGKDDEPDNCYLADRFAAFENNGHCENWDIMMPKMYIDNDIDDVESFGEDFEASGMYAVVYSTNYDPEATEVYIFEDEEQARDFLKKDCLDFIEGNVCEDVKLSISFENTSTRIEYDSNFDEEYWNYLEPIICS